VARHDSRNDSSIPRPPAELKALHRNSIVNFSRLGFLVVFIIASFLYITELADDPISGESRLRNVPWTIAVVILIGGCVVAADILTPKKRISTLVGILVGLAAGMLATWAFGQLIDLLAVLYGFEGDKHKTIVQAVKLLLGVCFVFLAITTVLQTQDDFRLVIPYVEFAKEIRGTRPLLLDSSALIDARFADLAETGIIQSPIIIPAFVVAELQLLADQSDKSRRARGRRGLDIVAKLQRSAKLDVSIDETIFPGKGVDQLLIEMARRMSAIIVTTDSGLARVAGIRAVAVVNIHELATALKPTVGLGDILTIRLTKQGEQTGQGVGYLDDGTMVVVDEGRERIGTSVQVTVTSTLQTAAGRLVFGRILSDVSEDAPGPGAGAGGESGAPSASGAGAAIDRSQSGDAQAPSVATPGASTQTPATGSGSVGPGGPGTPPARRPFSPRNPRR
jgi:uncharacterized protein YacL